MIFTSAFCIVLVLSYTSASTESKVKVEELSDKISSAVVGELIDVAKAAKGENSVELNKKLVETTRNVLKRMKPELKEQFTLSGDSVQQVSKDLAHKINHNKALMSTLPKGAKIKPRAVAQIIIAGGLIALEALRG